MIASFIPGALLLSAAPASATTSTGTGVGYTLEGCRASINAYIAPNDFRCSNSLYTTGNLGKGWNEFDLVPGRVTVSAGNSAPTSQDLSFVIAVDNCSNGTGASGCTLPGRPGYDQLSSNTGTAPQLNTSLSTSSGAGCGTVAWSGPQYAAPGIGGTGTTLYRVVTVSNQLQNTDCVYDFFARLAFNSHLFPGSSLHFNLANTLLGTAGIGSKDVSIPVSAILPPTFTKTQSATQGSNVVWTFNKSANPTSFNFPNTCSTASTEPTSQAVTVSLSWTKTTSASGGITVDGNISLGNNAHREIDVSVSDQLFNGTSPTAGNENTNSTPGSPIVSNGTTNSALNMGAGSSTSFDDIWNVPSGTATSFSDKATATFTDPVFNNSVVGTATATASTSSVTLLDATSGATASISDSESMTGSTDYDFSVGSVDGTAGSFSNYPTLGAHTRGPVSWSSGTLSDSSTPNDSGSTTFNKTVYVLQATTGTATLSDSATLTPSDQTGLVRTASSTFTSGATVSLTVSKTMSLTFASDKTFTFNVTGTDADNITTTGSTTVTIPAGQSGPNTGTITALEPGVTYTLSEPAVSPFPGHLATNTPPNAITVPAITLPTCSATQNVTNTASPVTARVQKITVPTGATTWTMTLTGVQADGTTPVSDLAGVDPTAEAQTVTANTSYSPFASNLDQDGATYTITETSKTGWDTTGVAGDIGGVSTGRVTTSTTTRTCSFTLNLTNDSAKVFSCSFTNTQQGSITIVKNAIPDDSQTFSYTTSTNLSPSSFSLYDDGATVGANTQSFTNLQAGQTYSVTEGAEPSHWDFTSLVCSATNTTTNLSTILKSGTTAAITLGAGDAVTCTYTNTKEAHLTLVKKENGGTPTHTYEFVLSQNGTTVANGDQFTDAAGNIDFGWHPLGAYTLCEVNIPAGTTSDWGTFNAATDSSCGPVTLTAGQVLEIDVNNTFPLGNALTIGYWKNWNTCAKADAAKAAKTGNHLMDEFLPVGLPPDPTPSVTTDYNGFAVSNACIGVAVLSSASSKYAENQLAAQLLAAILNIKAGAHHSATTDSQITAALNLLTTIHYAGPPSSIIGNNSPYRAQAVALATYLNNYNNDLVI